MRTPRAVSIWADCGTGRPGSSSPARRARAPSRPRTATRRTATAASAVRVRASRLVRGDGPSVPAGGGTGWTVMVLFIGLPSEVGGRGHGQVTPARVGPDQFRGETKLSNQAVP